MGCIAPTSTHNTIQIKSHIYHLIVTNQTNRIIEKIEFQPVLMDKPINYKGDTIAHYACSKNNTQLVQYLLSHNADFLKQNYLKVMPIMLITCQNVRQIVERRIGCFEKILVRQISLKLDEQSNNDISERIGAANTKQQQPTTIKQQLPTNESKSFFGIRKQEK